MRPIAALVALAVCLSLASAPRRADAQTTTFAGGSFIVPMDTDYQDRGMLRAYGLVYALLHAGVPVYWVVSPTKAHNGVDFTASARDDRTSAVITAHGYRGGPFVIDAANAAAAMPIVNTWLMANAGLNVHITTAPFTGFVLKALSAAPTIAIFADGTENVAFGYLNAAGIPDSNNRAWPSSAMACPYTGYPDVLCAAQVAGTLTNHHDGALFDSAGLPIYCQMMSMHWDVRDASTAAGTEVVAEYRSFLGYPVHLFAECQAVDAIENNPNGHFLTTGGYVFGATPSTYDFYNDSVAFAQMDGPFTSAGGSEPSYTLAPGSMYRARDNVMITDGRNAAGVIGNNDVWMSGYPGGTCSLTANVCGGLGKISYLGGHRYPVNLPISSNPQTNGVRLFLNALFEAQCAETSGAANIVITKSAPANATTSTVTFTIDYSNAGASVARALRITDPLPAGSTFVSADNGGVFSAGTVTWTIGDVAGGGRGSVHVTVTLGASGHYRNTAFETFLAGTTTRASTSNTTDTAWGLPYCGDSVCNGTETCSSCALDCGDCPPVCATGQTLCGRTCVDLASDPANCGSCGTACTGGMVCSGSACVCPPGQTDCGGTCVDTNSDPAHCGACATACSVMQSCSTGVCQAICGTGLTSCSGACVDLNASDTNCGACGVSCTGGTSCVGGACVCPAGQTSCSGVCVDTRSSASNCGSCGTACAATEVCSSGVCVPDCAAGTTLCGTTCVDRQIDGSNCGMCGHACTGGTSCVAGACTCPAGQTLCSGVCVNTGTSASDCGTCGNACASGQSCASGACVTTCPSGTTNCGGSCVDTSTSAGNCGGCGVTCTGGMVCRAAACACPAGFANCSGMCIDVGTSTMNCGACGTVCSAGQNCVSGACVLACPAGSADCSGTCVSLGSDSLHCGACGNACTGGAVCASGVCQCPGGEVSCSGVCADPQRDTNNCGACGTACVGGMLCIGGACTCAPGTTPCGGACVDTTSDANNCGACGVHCSIGTSCVGGSCPSVCGDSTCDATETCGTCAVDCGACPPVCGDGTCNGTETCATCPGDCAGCAAACGDGLCNGTETCSSCAGDCGSCPTSCGDGTCNGLETCESCAADCGACAIDGGTSDGGSDAAVESGEPMFDAGTSDGSADSGEPMPDASVTDVTTDVVVTDVSGDAEVDAPVETDSSADVTGEDVPAADVVADVAADAREAGAADAGSSDAGVRDGSVADASDSDGSTTHQRAGCGCRVPVRGNRGNGPLFALAVVALAAAYRRRRRAAHVR